MSSACARLDRSSRTAPIILYTGTNAGYQLFVSSSGPDSAAIPYVVTGTGLILGFSGSIIDANLTAGTYSFYFCKNVITNAVVLMNVLATMTMTVTANISGTLAFTSESVDVGPYPTYVSAPNTNYQLAPATTQWTSVLNATIARGETLSLFTAYTNGANSPASAQYQVYISASL